MLMAGGSLVAGSDNPHFGTSMPLGAVHPSFSVPLSRTGQGVVADPGLDADGARAALDHPVGVANRNYRRLGSRSWGHQTICSKLHGKPFGGHRLPFRKRTFVHGS